MTRAPPKVGGGILSFVGALLKLVDARVKLVDTVPKLVGPPERPKGGAGVYRPAT
jgi:hypothetical protein